MKVIGFSLSSFALKHSRASRREGQLRNDTVSRQEILSLSGNNVALQNIEGKSWEEVSTEECSETLFEEMPQLIVKFPLIHLLLLLMAISYVGLRRQTSNCGIFNIAHLMYDAKIWGGTRRKI